MYMGVSENRGGPPKSSILIRFSIINHPFGVPLFLETSIVIWMHLHCNELNWFGSLIFAMVSTK